MQVLIDRTEVPPGRYRFICPETGWEVVTLAKRDLFERIEAHYKANALSLPSNWKIQVEDRICQGLPPGWCQYVEDDLYDTNGEPHIAHFDCRVTREMLINGVKSLSKLVWEVFIGQDVFVPEAEATARAEICCRCHFNIEAQAGCTSCGTMKVLLENIAKIRGDHTTKWDAGLKNCCKCGCRNEAIVHIKKDILLTGQTPEDMLQYPLWCWKRSDTPEQAKQNLSLIPHL